MRNIDEKIFMKTIYDELSCLNNTIGFGNYAQKIKSAAMVNGELKNLSVRLKNAIVNYVEDFKKVVNRYANHKKITNKSFKEQVCTMYEDIESFCKELDSEAINGYNKLGTKVNNIEMSVQKCVYIYTYLPITDIANGFNKLIKSCDHNMNFITSAFGIRPDSRYGDTTIKRLLTQEAIDNYESYSSELNWHNIDECEKKISAENKVDLFSPENGKLVVKKIRAFKADVISLMHKYFGPQSVFAEFNIPELVL